MRPQAERDVQALRLVGVPSEARNASVRRSATKLTQINADYFK